MLAIRGQRSSVPRPRSWSRDQAALSPRSSSETTFPSRNVKRVAEAANTSGRAHTRCPQFADSNLQGHGPEAAIAIRPRLPSWCVERIAEAVHARGDGRQRECELHRRCTQLADGDLQRYRPKAGIAIRPRFCHVAHWTQSFHRAAWNGSPNASMPPKITFNADARNSRTAVFRVMAQKLESRSGRACAAKLIGDNLSVAQRDHAVRVHSEFLVVRHQQQRRLFLAV